jgi:quinol-cytochrome oxidoreductase complex cytochrome b subunit
MVKSKSQERKTSRTSLYDWFDERLGLKAIIEVFSKKTVPIHNQTYWYYWGGITLTLFIIQILTGILLLIYYRPGPEAYDSVRKITYEYEFGWLIRSVHHWAANLMVFSVFVHMFSTFFMRAYRKPREFNWWLGFAFSGYLLPFDELSYFATKIGLGIPQSIPIIGPLITSIAQGGTDVTDLTIQRFFTLHVMILPLTILLFLTVHIWLMFKHGSAIPPSEGLKPAGARKNAKFFPDFFIKDFSMWLAATGACFLLAVLFPPQLGSPADPLRPAPEGIHPEWYFMSPYILLKLFGRIFPGLFGTMLSIFIMVLALVVWAAIPLYDPEGKIGKRVKAAFFIGVIGVTSLIILTVWAYLDI